MTLFEDGKKTDTATVRLTHEEIDAIDKLSAMEDIKRSEWLRDAVIEKLAKYKNQYDCLSKVFGEATNTLNTTYSENN